MKVILASIAAIALVAAKAGAATPNLRVSLDSSATVDEDSAADYFDMLDILGFHSVVDDVSRRAGVYCDVFSVLMILLPHFSVIYYLCLHPTVR
jgi:hypothetical protein